MTTTGMIESLEWATLPGTSSLEDQVKEGKPLKGSLRLPFAFWVISMAV